MIDFSNPVIVIAMIVLSVVALRLVWGIIDLHFGRAIDRDIAEADDLVAIFKKKLEETKEREE